MEMYATTVYVIADEVLRILNLKDDIISKKYKSDYGEGIFNKDHFFVIAYSTSFLRPMKLI